MKTSIKIVSITLFLSAIIMLVSFGEQKAEWKGKVDIEKGIKVIKNPREPLYGEIKDKELLKRFKINNWEQIR